MFPFTVPVSFLAVFDWEQKTSEQAVRYSLIPFTTADMSRPLLLVTTRPRSLIYSLSEPMTVT
jgi:hypothetical protein